ncbi:MAG: PilZ domain-containing protein [Rhodobacter sp.]|nr:PilZ domain-containing protein [Rhodobacter sp.]
MASGAIGAAHASDRPDRPSVAMPCVVDLGGMQLEAQLVDIGYGGLGLLLPEQADLFEPETLFEVSIEGLGIIEVECRWRRGERIGAQFFDETAMQTRVQWFMDMHGIVAE